MSRLMVTDGAGKPVVEIFTDAEGRSSAKCIACPWAEDYRGRLTEIRETAGSHVDSRHPGGTS